MKVENLSGNFVNQPFLSTHASDATFKFSDGKLNLPKMTETSSTYLRIQSKIFFPNKTKNLAIKSNESK